MERLNVLSNNQLKMLAMVCMLIDHIGMLFFPRIPLFRILGRLSFPLFAYMIAEGCRYTRHRLRYFLSVAILAALCQVAFSVSEGSLYQNILVTFSLSIAVIFSLEYARSSRTVGALAAAVLTVCGVLLLNLWLPSLLKGFALDYGLSGILLPVLVYFAPGKLTKVAACGAVLTVLALVAKPIQWYALLALPLLLLYNGQRGRYSLKYVFYLFYPLHLLCLQGIKLLLS